MNASKYDAVLSYHMNPLACGVCKFNVELARRLGVPCGRFFEAYEYAYDHPLISIKPSEMDPPLWYMPPRGRYDLMLHDRALPVMSQWLRAARAVFYADELGCPSTLTGHSLRRGAIHVLTFGMAHKRCLQNFERLKTLLDQWGRNYTIGVSSAIHEGSPWAETWAASDTALRAIFGDHLRQYGFLADDGLVNAIDDADVIALFYDPGVRANNTSIWGAMERARVVITNLDEQSPKELIHGETVYDIGRLDTWPGQTVGLRWAGQALARGRYGWDAFLDKLSVPSVVSHG